MDSIGLFQGSITVIHVLLAILIIALVLVQGGNSGGMGAAFGGGNTEGVFGATGGSNFMQKLTLIFTLIFLLTSMFLGVMQNKSGDTGLMKDIQSSSTSSSTIETEPASKVNPVAIPAEVVDPVTNQPTATETKPVVTPVPQEVAPVVPADTKPNTIPSTTAPQQ